jgi:hypothetical protein
VLAAQIRSLKEEHTFRALINPDTGDGMGDSGVIDGAVSWHWFTLLFGAFVLEPGRAAITGPFHFVGDSMRWTQHGVVIARDDDGTTITFPTGTVIELPPDAEPQVVNDPKVKKRKQRAAPPPPEPQPPADQIGHPDDGLLPDGV